MRHAFCIIALLGLVGFTGCGRGYKIVPVSGTVKLDGKPLSNAMVLTQPLSDGDNLTPGPGSIANTDDQGRFVLELQTEPIVGAVPGKAHVKIVEVGEQKAANDDSVDSSVLRSKVPLDYQEGNKVEIEIPEEGTDSLDFDLKGERRRRR